MGKDFVLDTDSYLDILVFNSIEETNKAFYNYTQLKSNSNDYMNTTLYFSNAYEMYSYSSNEYILSLSLDKRKTHKITHHAIFISTTSPIPSLMTDWMFGIFMNMNTIMANQVIRVFRNRDGNLKEHFNGEIWRWSESHYTLYSHTPIHIILQRILYSVIAFAMVSTACAAMTRIGLMASNVAMLILSIDLILTNRQMWTSMLMYGLSLSIIISTSSLAWYLWCILFKNKKK